MDVFDIVREYLIRNGYGGLSNGSAECACQLSDLAPCGEMCYACTAGFKNECCTCAKKDLCDDYADIDGDPDFIVSTSYCYISGEEAQHEGQG